LVMRDRALKCACGAASRRAWAFRFHPGGGLPWPILT
jgi:hypothetical protein